MYTYPQEVVTLIEGGNKLLAEKRLMEIKGYGPNMARILVERYEESLSGYNNSSTESTNLTEEPYNNVIRLFYDKVISGPWKSIGCNDIDSVLLPNDTQKSTVRTYYNIPVDEEILFIRDTSFWNNNDQGLVLTNKAIYVICDNEKPEETIHLPWSDITEVTYKELNLLFWDGTNQPIRVAMYYFVKTDDNKKTILGSYLAKLFTEIAKMTINPIDIIESEYNELKNTIGEDVAFDYAKEKVNTDPNATFLYVHIACYLFGKKEWEDLLYYCNEGISKMDIDSWNEIRLRDLRAEAYKNLGNYSDARRDFFNTFIKAPDDMKWGDTRAKDIACSSFNEVNEILSEHILELPYKDRKVIMPVSTFQCLDNIKSFTMIGIETASPIEYPLGHPIANQLYVGHPYIPNKYIPFDTYQLELVEDKVREFCYMAQCLGATEISIECINSNNNDLSQNLKKDININAGNFLIGANSEIQNSNSMRMINELSRSISLHQTYEPHKEPYLPQDLVWYSSEPSWQRLYSQRMNGGLLSHEERIETKKSQMVNSNELSKLNIDISYFYADLNLNMTKEEEDKYKQQENAILAIKVKFAGLKNIQSNVSCPENSSLNNKEKSNFSVTELEYLKELKECLSDDYSISDRERHLLDTIRKLNGISEERALELEKFISPQLTEKEKEYLNEYRDVISNGEISPRDKRFLEKLKEFNGITDERAREIEQMV